jgi:hypothetical protein
LDGFSFGRDFDLEFILGHNGAVPITTNKMGHHRIAATMLRITWTERWLEDGLAELDQSLGLVGHQN